MTKEEREDAINFFREVSKREVGTYCELAIEALESKEKTEYDYDIMKAYNNGQAYILDILQKELELIEANEQETNGKTDYLKGITTCLDIIGKYREGFILPLPESEKKEWIPVSEKLPELNRDVLVCVVYKDYEPEIYTGYLRKDIYDEGYKTWWSRSRGEVSFPIIHDVVAWMPLPEPYEPESEKKL